MKFSVVLGHRIGGNAGDNGVTKRDSCGSVLQDDQLGCLGHGVEG